MPAAPIRLCLSLLAATLSLAAARANTVVSLGTVSQISGPQSVDLVGEIVYAINFSTDDPVRTVAGVQFRPDNQPISGATLYGPNNVTPWQTRPEFGASVDANEFEEIMHDIRWATNPDKLSARLTVNAGEEYKLQVLFSGNSFENRKWDIRVNGQNCVDEVTSLGASPGQTYAQSRSTMFTYQFTAPTATVVVEMGSFFGANEGGDRNPIWQALTLERVFIPPAPDDLTLAPSQFFGNQTAPVGTFTVADRKSRPVSHTLSFVSGAGDVDNAKFTISGMQLLAAPFDFSGAAPGTTYSIRVRANDAVAPERVFEKQLTITVAEARAPSAVTLDASAVSSASQSGMLAGILGAADENAFDQHTFNFVNGAGGEDNALFTITGRELRFAQALPAGKGSVAIRLRATDLAGLSVETAFTLPVIDPKLRINEFLAGNTTGLKDETLVPQDWIEIYNELPQSTNIAGWYLTDDPDNLTKWRFPERVVPPNGFLTVFADGRGNPPDGSSVLHTSFSLSGDGERILLVKPDGVTVASEINPPEQFPNVTYGYNADASQLGYLLASTPNAANSGLAAYGKNTVTFSHPHGFYSATFPLTLTASAPGSTIRYTTNGTRPTATTGTVYNGPITISPDTIAATRGTRIIRAIAVNPTAAYAPVQTQTYLFINGLGSSTNAVTAQTNSNNPTQTNAIRANPTYNALLDDALVALPALSVVLPGGIPDSETAASIELFDPTGAEPGFQIDCGINATGTSSFGQPKRSMAAKFRTRYGEPKLSYPVFARGSRFPVRAATEFKELRLRSHSHDTFFWLGTSENPPVPYGNPSVTRSGDAQLMRNLWVDEMQLAVGQPGKHGRQVHLYLNGAYHGIYHVVEHPDEDYLASYYPGSSDDFHFTTSATKGSDHGNGDIWTTTWASVKSSLNNYTQAKRWVDVTNLADFATVIFYAGNDWDLLTRHNWAAAGPKQPDKGGWKFFAQDSDIALQALNADNTDQNVPDGIFNTLMNFPDFRVLFRDRVYKHCFHGGVLTPVNAGAFYDYRINEISTAIVAETARWQPGSSVSPLPWDRDQEWVNEWNYLKNTFFPGRAAELVRQLRARGWWTLDPPEMNQHGGPVANGFQVTFTAPTGTKYYTTDGSDPRLPGGAINSTARNANTTPLTINGATVVRTRAFSGSDWSGLNEALFTPEGTVAASFANLCPTEIHYNPIDQAETEFIEFANTSAAHVDASGVMLADAVDFVFPLGSVFAPGQRIVVVKNRSQFDARYRNGTSPWFRAGVLVAGEWTGSLENAGETLQIFANGGAPIAAFGFSDAGTWPGRADGKGSSLELKDPSLVAIASAALKSASLANPENWRPSVEFHGSPGEAGSSPSSEVVINEVLSASIAPQTDAIELLNTTDGPIAIGGWYLSDSSANYKKYRFPEGTTIYGGDYVVVRENDFNNAGNAASLVPFALDGDGGDDVFLLTADAAGNLLRFVDRLEFGPAPGGMTWGRPAGGSGGLELLASPTLGSNNSGAVPGYGAWVQAKFPAGTPSAQTALAADSDGDGLSNLDEYVYVRSPQISDAPAAQLVEAGGALAIQYRALPPGSGWVYQVSISANLVTWNDTGDTVETVSEVAQPDGSSLRTVRLVPQGGGPSTGTRFLRVEAHP